MGAIINLYVIPRRQDLGDLRAPRVAEMLVRERFVAPPCVVGPASVPPYPGSIDKNRLVQPQGAFGFGADERFVRKPQRYFELPATFPDFGATPEPEVVAFSRLDVTSPAIREDFTHYKGPECSLGLYIARKGFRLLLEAEFILETGIEHRTVLDATVLEWLHLQGKAAPWLDIYCGSRLDRAVRSVWPDVEVVENVWP
jgi:hypothetical protein